MNLVVLNVIIDNLMEMNELFADVAMGEGLAPLLMAVGTILVVFTIGVFGALSAGAVASIFSLE